MGADRLVNLNSFRAANSAIILLRRVGDDGKKIQALPNCRTWLEAVELALSQRAIEGLAQIEKPAQ
jgi:hypothetical protein